MTEVATKGPFEWLESAEHLCAKCDRYANCWEPVSRELWESSPRGKQALAEEQA